jgi:signal transduction histidine kinase
LTHHFSVSQLTLLVGGAVTTGALLILMVYFLHKIIRNRREAPDFEPKSPRLQDESSFAMATLQGVIARMKEQEKELRELRQQAEKRARETARLSENVLREMPNGLMTFDREGFLTAVNPALRRLLAVDIWARRRYPEILKNQSALAAYVRDCLEVGKTVAQQTLEYALASGEPRTLTVSVSPLHADGGEIDGALCLLTDLTEVRRLEEQVRAKGQLAALGAMAAGIAHEFKNSLATISGYAQLLRDGGVQEEDRSLAERIVRETRSLTQIVTDFLNLSKPLTLTAQPVDLQGLLGQAIDDLRRVQTFSKIQFRVNGRFTPVEGDAVLLRQAFSNLLRNASEAVAAQVNVGEIVIQAESCRQGDREFLKIQISDSGQGIPESDCEKVFLPFFTTKAEGSGLGLALVQKIIVTHNGFINLETVAPKGASFAIMLPTRQEAPGSSSEKPREEEGQSARTKDSS